MKKVISIVLLLVIIGAMLISSGLLVFNAIKSCSYEAENPVLSLEIENYGTVKMELYPEYAPNTVKNIIALANNGFYNGKVFYGMDDVVVYVGRDAEGNSVTPNMSDINEAYKAEEGKTAEKEDFKYEINGEFIANDFKENTLKHEKGVVSMVRADYTQQIQSLVSQSYNSASSQFTIVMNDDAKALNGMYAAFGKVTEGMDIVERIYGLEIKQKEAEEGQEAQEVEEDAIKAFASAPVITSATVDTKGVEYGLPETHEAFDYSAYLNQLMQQYYTQQATTEQ